MVEKKKKSTKAGSKISKNAGIPDVKSIADAIADTKYISEEIPHTEDPHKNKDIVASPFISKDIVIETQDTSVYYGDHKVLKNVSIEIGQNSIVAFIGPSGCGKSTFLRLFNRMNDYIETFHHEGKVLIDGKDIYKPKVRVEELRKKVGMVFQKPNPFPKSKRTLLLYQEVSSKGSVLQGLWR